MRLRFTILVALAACGGESAQQNRTTTDLGVSPPKVAFSSPGRTASGQSASDGAGAPGADAPLPEAGGERAPSTRASDGSPSPSTQAPADAPQASTDPVVQRTTEVLENLGYRKGTPEAPVHIVEFSDFGCGYCRKFHEETFPALLAQFVESGQVYWRIIPFNVGMFPNAQEAALAGECAGEQDRFDPMADGLFARQREWKSASPAEAGGILRSIAQQADLDLTRFDGCMSERRPEERVQVGTQLARQLGIRGTPTFFIDGFPVQGALPLPLFQEYITAVLTEKAKQTG